MKARASSQGRMKAFAAIVGASRPSFGGRRTDAALGTGSRQRLHGLSVRWRPAQGRRGAKDAAARSARAVRPAAASGRLAQLGRIHAGVCSSRVPLLNRNSNTKCKAQGLGSLVPRSFVSLALRMRAAPGRSGRAGTGFARATTAGAFGHSINETVVVRGGARYSTAAPNTSFKRTHNGGPGLLASAKPAAPLCAA
jgi:hypothetical protein